MQNRVFNKNLHYTNQQYNYPSKESWNQLGIAYHNPSSGNRAWQMVCLACNSATPPDWHEEGGTAGARLLKILSPYMPNSGTPSPPPPGAPNGNSAPQPPPPPPPPPLAINAPTPPPPGGPTNDNSAPQPPPPGGQNDNCVPPPPPGQPIGDNRAPPPLPPPTQTAPGLDIDGYRCYWQDLRRQRPVARLTSSSGPGDGDVSSSGSSDSDGSSSSTNSSGSSDSDGSSSSTNSSGSSDSDSNSSDSGEKAKGSDDDEGQRRWQRAAAMTKGTRQQAPTTSSDKGHPTATGAPETDHPEGGTEIGLSQWQDPCRELDKEENPRWNRRTKSKRDMNDDEQARLRP
jgi:hypothetical protein